MTDQHPLQQPGGEHFTIRQKVFKIFGAAFHVYDHTGRVIGFCKQKAFRLREDLRVYTDDSMSTELFRLRARSIIDFSATYDITTPDGENLGSIRRKGMSSLFRDSWQVFNANGSPEAVLSEDSSGMALARRIIPLFAVIFPQRFNLVTSDGAAVASYRTHFNLLVYKLDVQVQQDPPPVDLFVILAMGCLIAAIEGRQSNNDSGAGFLTGG